MEPQNTTTGRIAVPEETDAPRRDSTAPEIGDAQVGARASWWPRGTTWMRANWLLAGAIVAGLAARITFWAVTDRVIDDALITLKFDKNVADGVGLVHNLGDGHVQGFTSALSVLVPLPGELIAGGGGLVLLRLVSLAAFALTAIYAYRICGELRVGAWPTGFVLAFLALDQNQVFYGMAGMETQIAVAVLLAGVYYVLVEDYAKSGVALGLAPLARPDFLLWVAPAFLFLLLRNPPKGLRAGLIAAVIVAPWLIFTTLYYGSPIPNTIAAKSITWGPHLPPLTHLGSWIHFLGDRFSSHQSDWTTLAPFLEKFFVIFAPLSQGLLKAISLTVVALAIVGAAANWRRLALLPAVAFIVLFELYKVIFLTFGFFEWYGVPPVALLILFSGAGLGRVATWLAPYVGELVRSAAALRRPLRVSAAQVAAVPALCLAVAYAMQLPYTMPLEARIQHDIEDQVRVPLGQYLGRVVKPGQTITSESSGYVGYYTNATMYDFPGLVSKTVVNTLRETGTRSWAELKPGEQLNRSPGFSTTQRIAALLHPDWLILRPNELQDFRRFYPRAAEHYRPVRRFALSGPGPSLSRGGLLLFNIDRDFIVLRRNPEPAR